MFAGPLKSVIQFYICHFLYIYQSQTQEHINGPDLTGSVLAPAYRIRAFSIFKPFERYGRGRQSVDDKKVGEIWDVINRRDKI